MNSSISESQVFGLYQTTERFPVNFGDAWKWIGYFDKPTAKRALLNCNFAEEIDYRINAALSTASNPRSKEHITLTVDCFKMWAMMAGTERGKEVRLYFLECERKLKATPKTNLEMLLESVQTAIEHEQRLTKVEQQNADTRLQINQQNRQLDDLYNITDKNTAELYRLQNPYGDYYTVAGFCKIRSWTYKKKPSFQEITQIGKDCARSCRSKDIPIIDVYDMRFGTVGAYPDSIILDCILRFDPNCDVPL